MHLPPPSLPRFGGGERPPFSCKPPAPLTITMGQRLAVFASPNIPQAPNCRPDFISPPPFPPRERGWGERADTPVATLGAILCAVRIDFRLPPEINPYPAQPATGVLGQRPKRVLLTFARTKVSPRRAGVQIKSFIRLAPPIGDYKPTPAGQACLLKPCKRLSPPIGDYKLFHVHPAAGRLQTTSPRKCLQTAAFRPQAVSTASKHTGEARVGGCAAGPAAALPP